MTLRSLAKNLVLRFADGGDGSYRVLRGQLRGERLILGPDDRKIYLLGGYEQTITRLLMAECRTGMTCLDLGAHIGYFTLMMASLVGASGRVVALEPNPRNAEKIRKMLALNRRNNASVLEVAASDHNGTMPFAIEDTGSMGRLVDSPAATTITVPVAVRSIDELIEELGLERVGVIKMDIEGAEARVIPGMKRLLERCRPVVVCEWHPAVAGPDFRGIFAVAGYHCEALDRESSVDAFHVLARPN